MTESSEDQNTVTGQTPEKPKNKRSTKRIIIWVAIAIAIIAIGVAVALGLKSPDSTSSSSDDETTTPSVTTSSSVSTTAAASQDSSTTSSSANSATTKDSSSDKASTAPESAPLTKTEKQTVATRYSALDKAMTKAYDTVNFGSYDDSLTDAQWNEIEDVFKTTGETSAALRKTLLGQTQTKRRDALIAELTNLETSSATLAGVAAKHGDIWSERYSTGFSDSHEAIPAAYSYYVNG